jgi:hypothetical protein
MERYGGGGADNYRERLAVNPGLAARLFGLAFVTREQRTGAATSYLSNAATGQLDRAVLEAVFPSTQELLDIGELSYKIIVSDLDPHGSALIWLSWIRIRISAWIRIDLSRLDPDPCWECRFRIQKQGNLQKLLKKFDFQPFEMAWDLALLDTGPYWECGYGSRSKGIDENYQINLIFSL